MENQNFLGHEFEKIGGEFKLVAYLCEVNGCEEYYSKNLHPQYFCRGCKHQYTEIED